MNKNLSSQYDLGVHRPQVLLLGNGLFYDDFSWDEFINSCSINLSENNYQKEINDEIPYSIRANINCDFRDTIRQNKYAQILTNFNNEKQIYEKENVLLKELLQIPFDAILTTNYTYQIENMLDSEYVYKCNRTKCEKYAHKYSKSQDKKFLLHTFNRVDNHNIWHIHGEERRKSSIVLTHDEYGRICSEIKKYFSDTGDVYNKFYNNFYIKSWIDYFIVADIYVLGYGADFSEFDFWWLLGRRLREKAQVGTINFYAPNENKEKYNNSAILYALILSGINVETMGHEITDQSKDYNGFYKKAISDIKSKIRKDN